MLEKIKALPKTVVLSTIALIVSWIIGLIVFPQVFLISTYMIITISAIIRILHYFIYEYDNDKDNRKPPKFY